MKVLIDMNLSPRWLKFLAEAGLQAAHWSEFGAGDASDLDRWSLGNGGPQTDTDARATFARAELLGLAGISCVKGSAPSVYEAFRRKAGDGRKVDLVFWSGELPVRPRVPQ
jgi:hypothetical protein